MIDHWHGPILILLAALLYSAVGHGGASGYLAVMALLGIAPIEMRPTALLLNIFVSLIATVQFARAGHFRLQLFLPFAIVSVPAAYLAGQASLSTGVYRAVVGGILIVSSARFLFTLRDRVGESSAPPLSIALPAGGVLGAVAGLTGVGGGIFLSPLMILAGWASLQVTAATSAAFILVNSVAGLAAQRDSLMHLPEDVPWWIAAAVIGGLAGSRLGSRRASPPALRATLAVVLLVAGLRLLTD